MSAQGDKYLNEGASRHPAERRSRGGSGNIVPITPTGNRVPPHSNDAEVAVLGAMMLDRDAGNRAIQILPEDAFYREAHRTIYRAMMALSEKNQPIDIVTLTDELRRQGKLKEVGGSHYLSEINIGTPTSANVEHHCRIVFEKALKRQLIASAMEIVASCFEDTSDAFEELDQAEARVFEISESRNRSNFVSMKRLTRETLQFLEEIASRRESGNDVIGVPSGLRDLDKMTGGFQESDLIIIAARPSMGKTALAISMMRNAAVDYHRSVAFFSLEMSAQQLMMRLIAAEAKVDGQKLFTGNLKSDDWQRITSTIHRLDTAPIFIDDTPALSIMDLRARARLMKREHDIGLLIVDYLQLMNAAKEESREREISVISRGLKQLAKELRIPVIALSQLNRSVESRQDKRPMLSDLRESGSIEQDADVVMFVHRPEKYGILADEDGRPTEGMAELIIGKQRNGPTGDARVAFIDRYARFENLQYSSDDAPEYLDPHNDVEPF